jgi:hypothetical protein
MNTSTQVEDLSVNADIQQELVIDSNDFDIFSSLDDLKVETKAKPSQENVELDEDVSQNEETEEADEFEDVLDFDDLDNDDVNDYSENDGYEKEEEDVVEDEDEDEEDSTDKEESADEDDGNSESDSVDEDEGEEVEYDGYMVNLPDGTEVNLAEAVQGYRDASAVQEQRDAFEEQKVKFVAEAKNVMDHMELAKLEADRVIEDYDGFDWVKLSQEDPQKYVDNREFLDKYRARRAEIAQAMTDIKEGQESEAKATFSAQASTCIAELKADIPGWNDTVYNDLMDYAIENGAKEDEIVKCVDPSIFKMLHKAKQFDNGKQIVKAKVRKAVRSPKKVVKSAARSNKVTISKKATLIKQLDAGEMGSDIFNALED